MDAAKTISQAFPKFALTKQLGIFSWNPGPDSNSRLKPFADVTADDVLSRVPVQRERVGAGGGAGADGLADDLQRMALGAGVPQVLHSTVRLPVTFMTGLPPQELTNRFPNDPGYIVPLLEALQRGVSLQDIDFVLGGSALDVLANRTFDPDGGCSYLVQRAAGVIVVAKSKYAASFALLMRLTPMQVLRAELR
jgi:hypothetical protein